MSLFIGNISESIPREHLLHELRKFGEMEIWNFVRVTQGKFAYIDYVDENSARNALLSLNGRYLGGRILNIEYTEKFAKPSIKPVSKIPQSISLNGKTDIASNTISPSLPQDHHINSDIIHKSLYVEPKEFSTSLQETGKNINEMLSEDKTNTNLTKAPESEKAADDVRENDIVIVKESTGIVQEKKERKSKKNKCSKNKGKEIGHDAGENVLEAYGNFFKIKKINKHKDENSIVICELCQREFKKKSIRSHTSSMMHKSKIS